MCNLSKGVEDKSIKKGIKQGIDGVIAICRDLNLPEYLIAEKIQQQFHLTEEDTNKYLQKNKQLLK